MFKKSLFIFRRDLRIEDNTGLRMARENSETVIPCFILNPEQVGPHNNYRSMSALEFMIQSLKELLIAFEKEKGVLFLFSGKPADVVQQLIQNEKVDAVFVNEDYTPYSRSRDAELEKICTQVGAAFESFGDVLLTTPTQGLTDAGTPYRVFTPFYMKMRQMPIPEPVYHHSMNFAQRINSAHEGVEFLESLSSKNSLAVKAGGRAEGKALLHSLNNYKNYTRIHDDLAAHTTGLSAHLKFGTVSIREVAHAIIKSVGADNGLLRQLYWRDFFYHIAWHYPHVFGHPFNQKFEQLPWSTSRKDFERWCEGTTGFPLVDAGMRELNQTGFMHNRARLVVGSFLTKDLHINWLWGERYFAQKLTDYDPCVNNGNWQWVASTGCDAQPYFRIFNPWLQQKRYDPDCVYIKKWVPELRTVNPSAIHSWYKTAKTLNGYPSPMVDHALEALRAKELYKRCMQME